MAIFKNRRLRSVFWRVGLFKRISRDVANCLLCHRTIVTKNGSTTGLKDHLKRRHADYEQFVERIKKDPGVWLNENPSHFAVGCESSFADETDTNSCYIGTAKTERELVRLCHENSLRPPPPGTIDGLKHVHLICMYSSRPWKCACLAEWVADTGALYMRGHHNTHPVTKGNNGEEREEREQCQREESNGRERERQRRPIRTVKKERRSGTDDGEQTEGHLPDERAGGKNRGRCPRRMKKERSEDTAEEQRDNHASSVVPHERSPHQQQHFVDRNGNRWDFIASASYFRQIVAVAAVHGFVRTGSSKKYQRWWFKCKFSSPQFECPCRATWLSSQNSLFQLGIHNHPISADSSNASILGKKSPKTFSVSLSERRPADAVVRPMPNNGASPSSVTLQMHPPQFLKAHNGPFWKLSAILPPSSNDNVADSALLLRLRFVNEKIVGRAYYKCTNSNCKKTGVYIRSLRALYTRGEHTCQPRHSNESRANEMVKKTTKFHHLKNSRKRKKPLNETQVASPLASTSSVISSSLSQKQTVDCGSESRANDKLLPTHSGRTLLLIDDNGNCVEIPMQRAPTSPVKKKCMDIGRPELELQKVLGGQWEFVQRITDESQLLFYINRFNLRVSNSSKATGGRQYFNCMERGAPTKCPYRMMYMTERQALYQTREHNHSFSLSRRRKPPKLNIKGLFPTTEKQGGHFELHSFATDVKRLAEDLSLEFREERGRFVLILSSDGSDKENCVSSSSAIQQKKVLKWLVLADKQTLVRCSEYSRETAHDEMGGGGGVRGGGDGLVEGRKECWKKWGRVQFLRALRCKCIEYFRGGKTNAV